MSELVNLRTARKRRAREGAAQTATANRMAHAVSGLQAFRAEAARAKSRRDLDQHKIEDKIEKVEHGTGERQ